MPRKQLPPPNVVRIEYRSESNRRRSVSIVPRHELHQGEPLITIYADGIDNTCRSGEVTLTLAELQQMTKAAELLIGSDDDEG